MAYTGYLGPYTGPQIDAALAAAQTTVQQPAAPAVGEALVFDGATWVAGETAGYLSVQTALVIQATALITTQQLIADYHAFA